jgi:hypothetical protein
MSQSTEDGGLNGGASGVIAPREGGLQPVAKGRGRAARGGSQTPQQRQQKSREAKALRALSSARTAGAAGGLAVQGAAATAAEIVADAVASPGEESPTEADTYSSPKQKFWSDGDTCRMIVAACSDKLRPFLDKFGTQPNRLESERSSASNPQRPDDQFFTALASEFNDPRFPATLPWPDSHFEDKKNGSQNGSRQFPAGG